MKKSLRTKCPGHQNIIRLTKERIMVEAGKREVSFEDAKNMQTHIEDEIAASGLPVTEFEVG